MPSSTAARWFSWGTTVAVVFDGAAFSVGKDGWQPVNSADVGWDGRPISEAEARTIFATDFETFGEPPIIECPR